MVRGPNVALNVFGGQLHIVFGGADVVWVLRRRLIVPVAQVCGVAVAALDRVPREGFRLPGTSVPGVIRAGSYGVAPCRDLWDIRHPDEVLWVEFSAGAPYRRAILQVLDPHAEALRLRPELGAFTPS